MKEGDNCLNEECNGVYELKSKCKSGICKKRLRCTVCNLTLQHNKIKLKKIRLK